MKKIKKSVKLLIIFSFLLLITLIIIDNIYYINNKDKVKENRDKLKYTQINTIKMMSWGHEIEVTRKQLIDVGIIDTTQIENKTINEE